MRRKNCERFIKDVTGETDLKQKTPETYSEYTVLYETPRWEVKNLINFFRGKKHISHIYHPAPHAHETSKEQGIMDSVFHFITC